MNGADKNGERTIGQVLQDSGVGCGTNGTFVAGKPGLSGVYVIGLDKPDVAHEQEAEQGDRSEPCCAIVAVSGANQNAPVLSKAEAN